VRVSAEKELLLLWLLLLQLLLGQGLQEKSC
jgi:hypothetical protein